MDNLRTVTVLEHEFIPVVEDGDLADSADAKLQLTATEAQALLRLNDRRRGFCQSVSGGVKLAQYCGIVRLGSRILEVLPKVGMADIREAYELEQSRTALLTMLRSARRIEITRVESVAQRTVRAPLLDIFIETFLQLALEQARRGLLCRYVPHADDLPVVKGRFNAHGHLRKNLSRPHLLHCDYDEFTADNPYNRAIRATLEACRTWITRESTQRLWFEIHTRFANIAAARVSASDVARLPRDRTTRRYSPLLTWCEWLLAMTSPAIGAGNTQAPGLLFDMNKLFESHVSSLEEAAAGDAYVIQRQGPAESLAVCDKEEVFTLKPDLTVWRAAPDGTASHIVRVVDAKWKRLNPQATNWGVDQADMYQLLAYALRYRCDRLELVYPAMGPASENDIDPPTFKIPLPSSARLSIDVQIKMVPLWH